jgi:hypothetical protein
MARKPKDKERTAGELVELRTQLLAHRERMANDIEIIAKAVRVNSQMDDAWAGVTMDTACELRDKVQQLVFTNAAIRSLDTCIKVAQINDTGKYTFDLSGYEIGFTE